MAFKIYTYADPYRIHQTDFWGEIKRFPHLCASRTLARGIMSVLPKEEIQTLFCPLDSIVKDRIFSIWTNDISKRIQQYSELGKIYKNLHDKSSNNKFGDERYEAFTHNKNSMLEALRLFIELGISSKSLNTQNLNVEHKLFAYLLRLAEQNSLFALPKMPDKESIKRHFLEQAEWEKTEKERLHARNSQSDFDSFKNDLFLIDRMIISMKNWNGNNIVVHGVHQFSPLQLRFLTYLDSIGTEIIFLYNFIPAYKEIYSSWNYIYQQFDAPIHHDKNIRSYQPTLQFPRTGFAIATNLALLCEENNIRNDPRIIKNYELYKDEAVISFDNISEYAGYVSDLFAKAEKKVKDNQIARDMPFKARPSTSAVLAQMDDVIYTANKEVDELLQVYHPEYARNRHFLAYPIGQFFVALYSLWDAEKGEINIDYGLLRECVNSGIMTRFNTEQLLKTLMNVEPLFSHVTNFTQFNDIFTKYRQVYDDVTKIQKSFQTVNLYNPYKVSKQEIEDLHSAIQEINKNAKFLFGDSSADEQFQFSNHFRRLRDFVDKKQTTLANEEEKDLISSLIMRLETVQKQLDKDDRKGTLEDLRSGLYFFLKQKEEPVSDWFVRNFEQIDGDVLLSRKQNTPGREKVYHFACVSNKDMNRTVNELLPWPITEMFIERAYNPKELPFQVYYASLGEQSNYLRYALFYGLYFSQCDTKISFVKRYGDTTTDYYEMLRLIGLKGKDSSSIEGVDDYSVVTLSRSKKITSVKYDHKQMAAMFFCPYRFLMDYVLNPHPIISGNYLFQKYFVNILIEKTWKTIQGKDQLNVSKKLSWFIEQESLNIERFFPFFTPSEIIDMKKQVENYISTQVFKQGFTKVREYDAEHMELRKLFGKAEFVEDLRNLPQIHHYSQFELFVKNKNGKRSYSVHSIPKTEKKELKDCMLNYINETIENMERPGGWCSFCSDKGICLASFTEKQE